MKSQFRGMWSGQYSFASPGVVSGNHFYLSTSNTSKHAENLRLALNFYGSDLQKKAQTSVLGHSLQVRQVC